MEDKYKPLEGTFTLRITCESVGFAAYMEQAPHGVEERGKAVFAWMRLPVQDRIHTAACGIAALLPTLRQLGYDIEFADEFSTDPATVPPPLGEGGERTGCPFCHTELDWDRRDDGWHLRCMWPECAVEIGPFKTEAAALGAREIVGRPEEREGEGDYLRALCAEASVFIGRTAINETSGRFDTDYLTDLAKRLRKVSDETL